MSKKFTCVDLFSGAGGLSRGFYDAGYDVVLGVDFDEAALKTFRENHGNAEAMKLDLFNHDNINVIVDFLRERDIKLDVLVGGPPCQGFSIAGPRDMNDKRNSLYLAMVELADRIKPQAVVLENVPGMLQTNGGIGARRIVEDFKKMGKRYPYMVHTMTDETYAVNCSMLSSEVIRDRNAEKENDRKRRFDIMFYVALFSRISWMVGAVLGGILGQILPVKLEGIDFCMTALFITIAIDQWRSVKVHLPALAGFIGGVLLLLLIGKDYFLLPTLILVSGLLLICERKVEAHE